MIAAENPYGPAAETVGEVVRRLAVLVRSARAEYAQTFNPPRSHLAAMSETQRQEWRLARAEQTSPLSARCVAFAEALAAVMGWPAVEAEPDRMVQTLLEMLEDDTPDGPLDAAALKARVEAHTKAWRGY